MRTIGKAAAVVAASAVLVLGGGIAYAAPPTTTWTVGCTDSGHSPTLTYQGQYRYLTRSVTALRSGGGAYFEWARLGNTIGGGDRTLNYYPSNVCTGGNWTKTIWQ